MWASLCNFLYDKLFYKPEIKSRASKNDSSVDSLYGKRLKLSNPDSDTNGLLDQTQNPERVPMQAKENLFNNGDEDECCVIAEIPKRKIAGPSTSTVRKYDGVFEEKSSTRDDLDLHSSFQRKSSHRRYDSRDIEVLRFKSNLERDLCTKTPKTPNRNSKFFNTQRTSLSQSKAARSKMTFKVQMKKKLNLLQESYRLTEKLQYMELLQSHTSSNLLPLESSRRHHQKEKFVPKTEIPVIDLTEEKTCELGLRSKSESPKLPRMASDDQDVQIIKEIPGVRSFEDMIKMRPVNAKEAVQKILKKESKINPEILSLVELEQDAITLLDDDDDDQNKNYSDVLEERLRKYMKITEHSKKQQRDKDLEDNYYLPDISPEQQVIVEEALKPGSSQEVLVEGFGITITRRDMKSLSGLNWLNDEVINFYMHLIMDRSKKNKTLPKVYAFNTFFYPKLVSGGYSSLKRWTKQVDLFSFDIVLVPIHLQMHWCLSVIDFRSKTVKYYDSIGAANNSCLDRLLLYLQGESLDKKRDNYSVSDWEKSSVEDIPQQMNGSDCGVFTCVFAEHLARDSALLFSQDDMLYFRKKIVLEIMLRQILN